MVTPEIFLSCDWGTTNLRLYAAETSSARVLRRQARGPGIKQTHTRWQATGGDRLAYFMGVLEAALGAVPDEEGPSTDPDYLVVSGMASSSVGIQELEYATLPFPLTGETVVYAILPHRLHDTIVPILISGVRTRSDVIRGEETQMIGLAAASVEPLSNATYVLPGTHSKHISVESGAIRDFRTFMTGELFQVVSEYTILRDCVSSEPFTAARRGAFLEGVHAGAGTPNLLHDLFTVRTASLFGERAPPDNFWFLSGLLIGAELAPLARTRQEVVLAAAPPHRQVYEIALSALATPDRLTVLPEDLVEHSAVFGQAAILRRLTAG